MYSCFTQIYSRKQRELPTYYSKYLARIPPTFDSTFQKSNASRHLKSYQLSDKYTLVYIILYASNKTFFSTKLIFFSKTKACLLMVFLNMIERFACVFAKIHV